MNDTEIQLKIVYYRDRLANSSSGKDIYRTVNELLKVTCLK